MVLFTRIFLNLYNKVGRNGWDSAAVGIVENPKVKILHTNPNLGEIQNFYGKADNSAFAV